jgi:hypothetical protein
VHVCFLHMSSGVCELNEYVHWGLGDLALIPHPPDHGMNAQPALGCG